MVESDEEAGDVAGPKPGIIASSFQKLQAVEDPDVIEDFEQNQLDWIPLRSTLSIKLDMEVAALLFVMNVHIKIAHLFHFSFQYYSVLPFWWKKLSLYGPLGHFFKNSVFVPLFPTWGKVGQARF